MAIRPLLITVFFFLSTQAACASAWKSGTLYDGSSPQMAISLMEVAGAIPQGGVVIVSERHGFAPHHRNQVQFLEAMAQANMGPVSTGLEFLAWPHQLIVDRFLSREMTEVNFLKAVGWGGVDFAHYREQVLFPEAHGGKTLAINAPRTLTSRIAKVGIVGLTNEEKDLLPPNFTLGNAGYFERFSETMKGHVPEDAIRRYFEAQSVWDETMAWKSAEFLEQNPDHRLLIVVGDFHAIYGGGLPDRLRARGVKSVTVVSQVDLAGLDGDQERHQVEPHAKWGPRSDYVWVERGVSQMVERGASQAVEPGVTSP